MEEVHKEGIAQASKLIQQYTYPFLTLNERAEPELIASCVFLEINENYFLVTAAHALRANREGLFTRGHGCLIDVTGNATVSRDEGRDNFDIASVAIERGIIREQKIMAIPSSMWSTAVEVQHPHSRAVSGFPASMNKTVKALERETKTFTGKCFTYFGSAVYGGEYERFEKSSGTHLGIEFLPGTDDCGSHLSTPIWPPRGFSGGGAWLIPDLGRPELVFLEGIFIEGHKHAKRRLGFSTRIGHVIDFILNTHNNAMESNA